MLLLNFIRRFILLQLLFGQLVGQAATPDFAPIRMHQTSWTAKDGAPPSIIGIAQTPDRWLWLASINGLYRFDGMRFEKLMLPAASGLRNDIWGMRVLANGDLWIGYRFGGASRWRNGQLQSFGTDDGLTSASVLDFAEDGRGRLWASTSEGFRVFDGTRWRRADQRLSGSTGTCFLQLDASATLWARCETGIFALARDAEAFGGKIHQVSFGRLAMAPDGTLWASGGAANELMALSGPGTSQPLPQWPRPRASGGAILFERDGKHQWVARADGVSRHGPDESGAVFGVANGLSGSMPNCFFQDIEDNIWVGTENGIDRFRMTALQGVAIPPIYWDAEAIAAGSNGALWIGANAVATPDFQTLAALPLQNANTAVSVVYAEGAELWTGGRDGLWHYRHGKRERIPLPAEATAMQFLTLARDSDGGLWVSIRKIGVYCWKDGQWTRGGGHSELAERASWISRDSRGRLWFGSPQNTIHILEDGKVSTLGAGQGLRVGTTLQVIESKQAIWVAGLNGLFHFDGQRFHQIVGENGDEFAGISGVIDDGDRFWLNGSDGVTVLEKSELALAVTDWRYRVRFRRLNHLDGLRGVATNSFPVPSAVRGSDHKLWFTTTAGLFWLDPGAPRTRQIAPAVYVRTINVDGVDLPVSAQHKTRIMPNPGRLQIDYTAVSLTMPERVRFQYRLDGVDRHWQEGRFARNASYTELMPGPYRFRVRAANHDGIWSNSDAVLEFEVAPAYYQTYWFRLLCVCGITATLWIMHKLRVAQVAQQSVARYSARMEERERIARDLHDTLLQSIHALLLRMGTVLGHFPPGSPARNDIERSLDLVQATLQEGQNMLHCLRTAPGADLLQDVQQVLLAEYPDLPLTCDANTCQTALDPDVYEQLKAMAAEALRNAARHANASSIGFYITHGQQQLVLRIVDDGCGIPPDIIARARQGKRLGLLGMRERAQQIDATLTMDSRPGHGTMITISLPATRAYRC